MRFRNRPWKLLALLVGGTVALIIIGLDLVGGEITLRRLGHLSAVGTPGRFWAFVIAYLIAWGFTILGWAVLPSEWRTDYRPPLRPTFEDPDRTRPL